MNNLKPYGTSIGENQMKFNFKLDVKGVPTANCSCEFECSPDELVTLISDPVYQELGKKLINEVSFKPLDREPAQQQPKTTDTMAELDKRLNSVFSQIKREMDADRKARDVQLHIVEKLMDKASKLAERNKF